MRTHTSNNNNVVTMETNDPQLINGEIVKTLGSALRNSKLDSTERATDVGFRLQTVSDEFLFLGHFIYEVLKNCEMANKILQSSKENIVSAMSSISSVRETMQEKRNQYTDKKIVEIIESKKEGK